MNGNDTIAHKPDIKIPKPSIITPKINPNIAKPIFIAIAQAIPSISQENITPGILIDHPAIAENISLINELERMQYTSAKIR